VGLGPGGGAPAATAELLADGGAAATSAADFFRSPEFLAAEGTTHTLRIAGGDHAALVPLIVREVSGSELRDAVSPYGYPGATEAGDWVAPSPADVDWTDSGLISEIGRASCRERV